jgi:hypothetical protein
MNIQKTGSFKNYDVWDNSQKNELIKIYGKLASTEHY